MQSFCFPALAFSGALAPPTLNCKSFCLMSLRTLLRFFALTKDTTPLFSIVSALCVKKHNQRAWGVPPSNWHTSKGFPERQQQHSRISQIDTHASPPDSHRSDFIALPAAPGGCRRLAFRACFPPSHSPRTHAGSDPRSRRFLRRHWGDSRGF